MIGIAVPITDKEPKKIRRAGKTGNINPFVADPGSITLILSGVLFAGGVNPTSSLTIRVFAVPDPCSLK
jgi:hypothetical protein